MLDTAALLFMFEIDKFGGAYFNKRLQLYNMNIAKHPEFLVFKVNHSDSKIWLCWSNILNSA
jgi:hypothetical protein